LQHYKLCFFILGLAGIRPDYFGDYCFNKTMNTELSFRRHPDSASFLRPMAPCLYTVISLKNMKYFFEIPLKYLLELHEKYEE